MRATSAATATATARLVTSPETALARDAEQMYAQRVDAALALRSLISRYRVSLITAEAALASAGYGRSARAEAVQQTFSIRSATASLAREGWTPRDTYLELRGWNHSPEASAGAVVDYYSPASAEVVALGMLDDGVTLEEVILVLRYADYSLQETLEFLTEEALLSEEEVLLAIFSLIQSGAETTESELDFIYSRLAELFEQGSDAGEWLRSQVGLSWQKAAEILAQAGYSAQEIAEWLKNKVGASAQTIAAFLANALGLSIDSVFSLLREVGFKTQTVASAVVEVFGASAQRLARLLHDNGISAARAITLLIAEFGINIVGQLYSLLTGGLYSGIEAGRAVADYTNAVVQARFGG